MTMKRISPRMMNRMMKQLGIKIEQIEDVDEVIIKRENQVIRIKNPDVSVTRFGGNTVYQVIGEPLIQEVEENVIEVRDEDVRLVSSQAGVSEDEARNMLLKTKGDLAEAILKLKQEKR